MTDVLAFIVFVGNVSGGVAIAWLCYLAAKGKL